MGSLILLGLAVYTGFAGWPWWWAAVLGAAVMLIEIIQRFVEGKWAPWLDDTKRILVLTLAVIPMTIATGAAIFTAAYYVGTLIRPIVS